LKKNGNNPSFFQKTQDTNAPSLCVFYKFGDTIHLPKIGILDWIAYICGRFEATGKHISEELTEKICRKVDNHSSYVQQLAWLV